MTARFLNRAALLLAVAAIAMTAVPAAAEIPDPFSCARPSLAGIYAFGSKGSMRVGNVAPDYAFDNVTINYESNDLEKLIPGIAPDGEYFMIEDDTLPVNTDSNGTSLLTAMYIDRASYDNDGKIVPLLYGGGGTAYNLCVWQGCPGYDERPYITCAYGMSTAFRKLVPYFDESLNLVHLHLIWVQSNNLNLASGQPSDQGTVQIFSAMLLKIEE